MKADIEVAEISTASITAEGPFLRQGGQFIYELAAGDNWRWCTSGGIIVTHKDRNPSWVKLENGVPVVTEVTPVNSEGKQ